MSSSRAKSAAPIWACSTFAPATSLECRTRTSLVGRVKRNLFRQSYVGAIFTGGHPALPIESRTYGTDVRLATSNVLGTSRNLIFNAYGLRSQNEGAGG